MKKLLYITDQDEYTDHSFIGPLFEKYLQEFFEIDIIYFSEFKDDFEKKDEHRFILSHRDKERTINEIKNSGEIDVSKYSYVIVRNDPNILKHVLESAKEYHYKVGYRLSFPKRIAKMQVEKADNKFSFMDYLNNTFSNLSETKLINQCDIFLPSSQQMQEEYFANVKIKTFICPPAIDPDTLYDNVQHPKDEKRFFYAGTLDKLREFETVIKAFNEVNNDNWKLIISTKDPQYAVDVVHKYAKIASLIEIHNASNKDELLKLIANADIGVSILPDIPLFSTSTPVKIMDYYSSAIPCIMTNNANNNTIFTNDYDAWFCKFTIDSIKEKIETILKLSKHDIENIGIRGQERLLEIRNYKKIAENLAESLNLL